MKLLVVAAMTAVTLTSCAAIIPMKHEPKTPLAIPPLIEQNSDPAFVALLRNPSEYDNKIVTIRGYSTFWIEQTSL